MDDLDDPDNNLGIKMKSRCAQVGKVVRLSYNSEKIGMAAYGIKQHLLHIHINKIIYFTNLGQPWQNILGFHCWYKVQLLANVL